MSPPEWHLKFAVEMLEIADRSLAAKKYAVTITAVLRAFDEIMDATAARDSGLHFHNDYPDCGPQSRVAWIKTNRPELFESWQQALRCVEPSFSDGAKMEQMVNILRAALMISKANSNNV